MLTDCCLANAPSSHGFTIRQWGQVPKNTGFPCSQSLAAGYFLLTPVILIHVNEGPVNHSARRELSTEKSIEDLPEDLLKAAFLELVLSQDSGVEVRESRELISKKYHFTASQVIELEGLGIAEMWPPL